MRWDYFRRQQCPKFFFRIISLRQRRRRRRKRGKKRGPNKTQTTNGIRQGSNQAEGNILEQETSIDPKVINLSNRNLTDSEILLLKKGLKFTPTPKSNTSELRADVNEFCRKLRLTELFYNEEDEEKDEPLVRIKTGWNPPNSQDQVIFVFLLEDTIQMIKDC